MLPYISKIPRGLGQGSFNAGPAVNTDKPMAEGYGRERLELLTDLLKKRCDVKSGTLWTLDPKRLRFKHGETIAELKVPYHMGSEDEAAIENAILALTAIFAKRYDGGAAEGAEPAGQALQVSIPPLKAKTFRTDIFIADSIDKRIASLALASTPHVDSSVISAWLSTDGHGKRFLGWVSEFFEKTLKDEIKHDAGEPTAYLALLAAINTIKKKKEKVKSIRIKGLPYEKIDLAVGMIVFTAFKEALRDTLERLKAEGSSCYSPANELLLLSSTAPKAFLSIPSNVLSSVLNPYGINTEVFDAVSAHAGERGGDFENLGRLIDSACERIRDDARLMEELKHIHFTSSFREKALAFLTEFDLPDSEARDTIFELYNEDRVIRNFLNDPRLCANLKKSLEEIEEKHIKDVRRSDMMEPLKEFLATFSKRSMLGSLLKPARRDSTDFVMHAVMGYYACAFDDHVEQYCASMRGYMADRRGEFTQPMMIEEYNTGRLYRFSRDDRPVLNTLEIEEEGQLFVDMKDFTRKTLKVKEIAMAEFMKEYFYQPILTAASRYGVGAGVVRNERGIRLTNIPGDAAIFSGGVTCLVSLARDIQQVIRHYRDNLLRKLPTRKEAELLEEVHKRFEARRTEIKRKRASLMDAMDRNEPGVEARLAAIGEDEHRLENTYRDEVETALKGELEAGLFITYGTKAETMVIEPRGDFSGPVKVSIGEKINEAARGTFRNNMVRAKLEILLEKARMERRNPQLRYPFDICIDKMYAIKMPPEVERAFEMVISTGKETNARAMAQLVSNEYLNDLRKIIAGEPFSSLRLITESTDIYNKGQALSEGALRAYMKENKGTRWFFSKTVEVKSLDESIRENCFFTTEALEFWFGHELHKGGEYIEAFHRSGEMVFKGFEAAPPTVVYEILNVEGELFRALLKHHFRQWLEESKADREGAPASHLI